MRGTGELALDEHVEQLGMLSRPLADRVLQPVAPLADRFDLVDQPAEPYSFA
jgi:hypothetical protein